ncbi:MAG: hypothetical protein COU25_02060 [Candidatus Levybacteria bacterium CG10_big_fil_rev_8_21_14_0_10_35_13]|nr:MAG: hypothetical protein COU25_02060 [Candidatus Levybacteria bacterium CG10_big_fil_rev_8_21_14_0_10_35_13]
MEGRYNDPEARRAREMTRKITRQFGDPNMGQEYRDPYARPMSAENATVFLARRVYSTDNVRK